MGKLLFIRSVFASATFAAMYFFCGAHAATLDFTNNPYIGSNGVVAGTTYTVSASGGALSWGQNQDGSSCFGLACAKDGLGVNDDEITNGNQQIIIDFGAIVRISSLAFLDLFSSQDGNSREKAMVEYNGGTMFFDALISEKPGGDSGFLSISNLNIITDRLVFSANGNNDNVGSDDYALAAIGVSAVPLPPALLMFGAALGGIGLLRRKRS